MSSRNDSLGFAASVELRRGVNLARAGQEPYGSWVSGRRRQSRIVRFLPLLRGCYRHTTSYLFLWRRAFEPAEEIEEGILPRGVSDVGIWVKAAARRVQMCPWSRGVRGKRRRSR